MRPWIISRLSEPIRLGSQAADLNSVTPAASARRWEERVEVDTDAASIAALFDELPLGRAT